LIVLLHAFSCGFIRQLHDFRNLEIKEAMAKQEQEEKTHIKYLKQFKSQARVVRKNDKVDLLL